MIRRQVEVPVAPDRVWRAITDPEELAGWFGARVGWELTEGGPATFVTDDGREMIGSVTSVRPERHLGFVWAPADGSAPASEVTYVIEPLGDGSRTRLTVTEKQLETGVWPPEPARGSGPDALAQVLPGEAEPPPATAMASWALSEPRTAAPPLAGEALEWTGWDSRLAGAWMTIRAGAVAHA